MLGFLICSIEFLLCSVPVPGHLDDRCPVVCLGDSFSLIFVLQDIFGYLWSPVFADELLHLLFLEECCGNFDLDLFDSIYHFWKYLHFDNVGSVNPGTR